MESIAEDRTEIKPCPVCMAPNEIDADFCADCKAPFGVESAVFPGIVVRPEGSYWRPVSGGRFKHQRPSRLELVGKWVLFLPGIAAIALFQITDLIKGFDSLGFVLFWAGVGLEYYVIVALYRVTADYFRHPVTAPKTE